MPLGETEAALSLTLNFILVHSHCSDVFISFYSGTLKMGRIIKPIFTKLHYLESPDSACVNAKKKFSRFICIYRFAYRNNNSMEHQFYRFDTLQRGAKQMIDLIKEQYCDSDQPVQPKVQPGFLRSSLPVAAPEQGESLEYLIQRTKNAIAPGLVGWQSPKFFGFYPHSINVTSVLAQMYTTTFHSPSFSYSTAPSYTELENIVIDWSTQALGLPEKFLIKNSGGGIINNSTSESVFVSAHAAKYKKMKQLGIDAAHPDILKFVGYFGEGSHLSSQRALLVKDTPYRRSIPYKYNPEILNYQLDYEYLVRVVEEDQQNGLIPFWCGLSWGNTFSAAIDVNQKVVDFCKEHNMWVNVDSAFLGSTWICEKFRPSQSILEKVDSLQINFTMLLLNGTGGSLFFVADKKTLNESFGGRKLSFSIFQNHFTQNCDVIDYKDWTIGLSRRNNALKIYYTFVHYGLKRLREALLLQEKKGQYAIQLIASYGHLFHVHAVQYVTVLFQLKDKSGKPSNKLTKLMAERVRNLKEGFTTPNAFQGSIFLRISAGNFHTTESHLKNYVEAIVEIALEIQQSNF